MTSTEVPSSPMLELLSGFIVELRAAGLPVSLTENLDAMEAITHIPIENRDAFKYALAATLVKNNSHWRAFETVFEVYFSLRGSEYSLGGGVDDLPEITEDDEAPMNPDAGGAGAGGAGEAMSPEQMAEMLFQAMRNGDDGLMRALACLLYTSPSPRDGLLSRMPSSA